MRDCREILVDASTSIRRAIEVIDKDARQIALVVDPDARLQGTITDGDIRRALLRDASLDDPVASVMNRSPTVIGDADCASTAYVLMVQRGLRRIPVVDSETRVLGLALLEDFLPPRPRPNWAIVMAGGLGSRLAPLTDQCPKPLLKVGPRPLLETILKSLIDHSFRQFFFSVNYKAEMIEDYFGTGEKWGSNIEYLRERKRLGTAGALSLLPEAPNSPFLVINGDLLTSVNFDHLLQFHAENRSIATVCVREYTYRIPYGVTVIDDHRLRRLVEKPAQRVFVNAGVYVLDPAVLRYIPKDTCTDMTELLQLLLANDLPVSTFPIREYWLDIGRMDDYLRANNEYDEVFG
ncbi:nucleotidyltransferase family protein [Alicyclobacillus sp. ALC3]|nr:nucleotidyltransferase family protein [Alicyclobacillus sp. ALC3]WDL99465.1 nucleotidyltransferase family protein [Alicyclobacillus sp. ALC3]